MSACIIPENEKVMAGGVSSEEDLRRYAHCCRTLEAFEGKSSRSFCSLARMALPTVALPLAGL